MNEIKKPSKPTAPKLSRGAQREARRRDILRATIRSIERVGFADTTLATVAEIAGVAQGSVVFHFKTKDDLLIETLRHMADEYCDVWQKALLAAPPDPVERLCALVATDFRRDVCTLGKIAVWKAFWAEAKSRPVYHEICGARDDARHAAVRHCVAAILSATGDQRGSVDVTTAIECLHDGLMESMLGGPRMLSRHDALRVAFLSLATQFPAYASDITAYYQRNAR